MSAEIESGLNKYPYYEMDRGIAHYVFAPGEAYGEAVCPEITLLRNLETGKIIGVKLFADVPLTAAQRSYLELAILDADVSDFGDSLSEQERAEADQYLVEHCAQFRHESIDEFADRFISLLAAEGTNSPRVQMCLDYWMVYSAERYELAESYRELRKLREEMDACQGPVERLIPVSPWMDTVMGWTPFVMLLLSIVCVPNIFICEGADKVFNIFATCACLFTGVASWVVVRQINLFREKKY